MFPDSFSSIIINSLISNHFSSYILHEFLKGLIFLHYLESGFLKFEILYKSAIVQEIAIIQGILKSN